MLRILRTRDPRSNSCAAWTGHDVIGGICRARAVGQPRTAFAPGDGHRRPREQGPCVERRPATREATEWNHTPDNRRLTADNEQLQSVHTAHTAHVRSRPNSSGGSARHDGIGVLSEACPLCPPVKSRPGPESLAGRGDADASLRSTDRVEFESRLVALGDDLRA
jgi:hypothetical protein